MNHDDIRLFKAGAPTLIVLDAEYRYDHAAHARYHRAERYTPGQGRSKTNNDPLVTPRWPCREMVALSWLILSDRGEEGLAPTRMETRGLPEQDERTILADFFADVATLGSKPCLVTWGGSAADIPPMLLAAAKHGPRLPPGLKGLHQPGKRPAPCHIDLMRDVAGHATWPHLAEVAAALDIPAKTICRPDLVSGLMEQGKWSMVKSVAEGDVLTTAMILMLRRLTIGGGISVLGAKQRLAQFVGKERSYRIYAPAWARFGDDGLAQAVAEQERLLPILAPALAA